MAARWQRRLARFSLLARSDTPTETLRRLAGRLVPYGIAALLLFGVQRSRIAESLDLLLYDLITTRQSLHSSRKEPITLIGISESDLATYGWPIDDRLICRTIDGLLAGGASAVGLDLYRDQGVGPGRRCLTDRFRKNPRLISIFNHAEGIRAIPGTPAHRQAFNDLILDSDGVVRRDLVHVGNQDEATVTFPLRLVEVSAGDDGLRRRLNEGKDPGPWLGRRSGGYQDLDAAGYQRMLQFRQPGSFATYSLDDVLRGHLPASKIEGHIVIIGSVAPSLRDLFEIPHTRFASGESPLLMPGAEIHALRTATLLNQQRGHPQRLILAATGWQRSVIDVLAILIGILVGESFVALRRSILCLSILALLFGALGVLLQVQGTWIGPTLPLTGLVLMSGSAWLRRGVVSQQHKVQMERLLGQTTSPAIAKQLWAERTGLLANGRFEGRQLYVTVVFADTQHFTTISETKSPAELLAWFNRGMAYCVPAITRHSGMVNKFTGDGFFAVFGAPLGQGPDLDAISAIQAVLEIQSGLERLNVELTREGEPAMRLRLGVHSGYVMAGSMGSSERLEYAIIGDTVNTASRLESLDKEIHENVCRILVSSVTRAWLPETWPVAWKPWGMVTIRGRSEPLETWQLIGEIKNSEPEVVQAKPD